MTAPRPALDQAAAGTLRILMLEDVASDADLIRHALRKDGLSFETRREDSRKGFEQALAEYNPDVILSDYNLPGYDGARALRLARERLPEVPVIMVTGELGDELAAELIKSGARDFVLKDRLARLGPAVRQALADAQERRWRIAQEQAAQRSEQRFQSVLDNLQQLAVMLDAEGSITYVNDHLLNLTGWKRRAVIGQDWFKLFIPPDLREEVGGIFASAMDGQAMARHYENEILTSSGEQRLIRWDNTPLFDENDELNGVACLGTDITDYRKAQNELTASEERFRKLIEHTADIIAITATDGTIRYINPTVERLGGYPPEQVTGRNFMEFLHPDDQAQALVEQRLLLAEPGRVFQNEERYRHRDGSWRIVEWVASNQLDTPGIDGIVVTLHDLTEIRAAQAALQERLKEIRCLHQVAELCGDPTLEETDLLERLPPLLTAAFRYPQQAGARLRVDGQDHTTICHETPRHRLRQRLSIEGRDSGFIEVCYPADPDGDETPFLPEERALLASAATTLARSLSARRSQRQFADSLVATVGTLAATVELRDPTTAGHQQRVAELATLIGRELGLSDDRLMGLSLGASIHDIGKLMIPAEILAKPARLSEVEYRLIQSHAQAGYELLQSIDFPWPVADMVHQHHERLDGSGYPRGTQGDDLLLESRILAVADVVEAMGAHRPYRPALDEATILDEIKRHSGTGFDPAVVDVCTRLIRDRIFRL